MGRDGDTRHEVLEKYARYLVQQDELLLSLNELEGKRLGCYCKPLLCHGDVLVQLINWKRTVEKINSSPTLKKQILDSVLSSMRLSGLEFDEEESEKIFANALKDPPPIFLP